MTAEGHWVWMLYGSGTEPWKAVVFVPGEERGPTQEDFEQAIRDAAPHIRESEGRYGEARLVLERGTSPADDNPPFAYADPSFVTWDLVKRNGKILYIRDGGSGARGADNLALTGSVAL